MGAIVPKTTEFDIFTVKCISRYTENYPYISMLHWLTVNFSHYFEISSVRS